MLTSKSFGFWHLLGSLKVRSLFWPDGIWGILIGLLGGIALIVMTELKTRYAVAGDYLVIASVFLGVVFASLALVISLLSDNYLKFLNQSKSGVLPFMAPFVIGVGIQAFTLVMVLLYRIMASKCSAEIESIAFVAITILFIYSIFDIISLSKKVIAHAVTRAEYLSKLDDTRY